MNRDEGWYDQINTKIRSELENSDPNKNWLPSEVESGNPLFLNRDYYEPRFEQFRSIILRDGGPQEWPDCQVPGKSWFNGKIDAHVAAAEASLRELKSVLSQTLLAHGAQWKLFTEDQFGHPYAYLVDGVFETNANIRNSFYFSLFSHYIPIQQYTSFMEIGGGYGDFAAKVAMIHPATKIFFLDLPRMALLAEYHFNNRPSLKHRSSPVRVMLPWEYPSFEGTVDVVMNMMSFQHMSEANLHYYFSRFRDIGVKQIFSINRIQGMRRGEAAAYGSVLSNNGYRLVVHKDLQPWRSVHFLDIWSL